MSNEGDEGEWNGQRTLGRGQERGRASAQGKGPVREGLSSHAPSRATGLLSGCYSHLLATTSRLF